MKTSRLEVALIAILSCTLALLLFVPAHAADAAKATPPVVVGTNPDVLTSTGTLPAAQEKLSCTEHTSYLVSIINALNLNNARLTAKIAALEAPQKERAALDAGRAIQSLTDQYLASHEMPPGCALRIDGTFVCPPEAIAATGKQPQE